MREFNYADAFGWSWNQSWEPPNIAKEVFDILLEARGLAQQAIADEAKRQAQKR